MMEKYSDIAIDIINDLHTERLDYESEYLPLIDCAQRCKAYEDTGLEPEEAVELAQAKKDGRLVVLHKDHSNKDGKIALGRAMWARELSNNVATRYTVDAIAEKLAREEVEAALAAQEEGARQA